MKKILVGIFDFLGKRKLMTMYKWIVGAALVVFLISLVVTNNIAENSIHAEYQEYSENMFQQVESEMSRSIQGLIQLSYTVMSNNSFINFIEASTLSEKSKLMSDEIMGEFSKLTTINRYVSGISVYNNDDKLVTNLGRVFKDLSNIGNNDSISFSNKIVIDEKGYFGITIPMYQIEKGRVGGRIGYCCIIIDIEMLNEQLRGCLPTENSWCVLKGNNGSIVAEYGDDEGHQMEEVILSENYKGKESSFVCNGDVVYFEKIARTGWELWMFVSNNSLYENINNMQKINYITYILMGILLLCLFVVIYASVFRPIREQTLFMNYYAKNKKSRMVVHSHNEMGQLAESLNAMLDDIDRLTEENLETKAKMLEIEYQKKQSELLAYRSQINPHFMHNTFECIRGMALYYKVPDIASVSEALARFFCYNVQGKGYAQISEIKNHVKDYAEIIGYRFMSKYSVEIEVDGSVNSQILPKMIIQPLVENAVFHGLEKKEEKGTVRVSIKEIEGFKLMISVEDNGCGMTEEQLKELKNKLKNFDMTGMMPIQKHGIGMLNIYRRLKLFYTENLEFIIDSIYGQGTRINIIVPLNSRLEEERNVPGFFG